MTYMVSTIVLALVGNMGAIIWENNFLMPHEFCLWVDLSAGAREREGRFMSSSLTLKLAKPWSLVGGRGDIFVRTIRVVWVLDRL